MIRTLLIASLATLAAAEAEPKADADPYLVYGGYPYTHGLTYAGYHPYYTLPVVKAAEAEVKEGDAVEEKKAVVPLHYPISYGYPYHYYGKRSADAEPTADADAKADPWIAYSGYTGYPYTYGHLPYYTHPVVTKKVVTVKADDSEEKKIVPLTLPYGGLYRYGYGYSGYPYTYGHLPYYTHPVVTKKVVTVKAAEGEEKKVVPLTLPYGGLYNYGYGYSGYPV